ncbi:MIF4G domain containing protein, putative [Babesia bigemina]|uniref:MIF4G domain containing protein, putative n=1 Tax=Babesia bigemina TaxID=5866 RepID=A0A061DAK0_BABBI|nr:MIF4G domain containing protein, putative [Babesia bigemina]CDR97578.1 MIF4G domain containing protein, putative [Babesia bigemina]|eukprot:XP_012769764.1 MIF4G domain containing protein, putative [Babesia bigemina]
MDKIEPFTPAYATAEAQGIPEEASGLARSSSSASESRDCTDDALPRMANRGTSYADAPPGLWRTLPRQNTGSFVEVLSRQLKSNLNKLTIEKFETLAEKIATQCEALEDYNQLQVAADLILSKAVQEPEWSEMYADLCLILFWRSREYELSGKRATFASALLTKIQREYEATPRDLDAVRATLGDDPEAGMKRLKTRILGTVKMIGELFQRRILGFKIVSKVVMDLVMSSDEPHEHLIECFLQLIYSTGYYIDQHPNLRPVLDMWFGRLKELMLKTCYTKRIKCVMQDVLDLPKAQWRKKIHRDTAQALSDLRDQVQTEDILGGSAVAAQYGNIVVVGERRNLGAKCTYGDYMVRQEDLYKAKKSAGMKL